MKKRLFAALAAAVGIFAVAVTVAACVPEVKFYGHGKIVVAVRANGSGTKTAFFDLIDRKETAGADNPAADPRGVIVSNDTAAILAKIKGDGQVISYDSLGFVKNADGTDKAGVKTLRVNGVAAGAQSVKDGTYTLARPLRVLFAESVGVNAEYGGQRESGVTVVDTGIKGEFLKFLTSKDAQKTVEREGYVSDWLSSAPDYVKNGAINGGTVRVAGSTSLKPLMEKLAAQFKGVYPNANVDVSGGGSAEGYKVIREGSSTADFGMISDANRKTGENGADGAAQLTVARDGIAVIVNALNPVNNITVTDLQNIFSDRGAKNDADRRTYNSWNALTEGRTDLI